MLNFAVGPVMSSEEVLLAGSGQVPYFRTAEFSALMKENEKRMCAFAGAPDGSRCVFLTGSGTAAMEAAVMNAFCETDRVLVVDGGSFGHRFAQLCDIHDVPHEVIPLPAGSPLTKEDLLPYDGKGITGFLVNLCETSTGVLYDLDLISDFCARNGIFLIVDAVSAFLTEYIDMEKAGIGILLTGSQKALACAPGISLLVLSPEALRRVQERKVKSMYFDLADALKNGERGQTPFTPAVSILLQIHTRLKEIEKNGGAEAEVARVHRLAEYFREQVKDLPVELFTECASKAVTPLRTKNVSAYDVFLHLKDEYDIWICPNGGDLADVIFRVGHMGALTEADYDTLISALRDLEKRGLL